MERSVFVPLGNSTIELRGTYTRFVYEEDGVEKSEPEFKPHGAYLQNEDITSLVFGLYKRFQVGTQSTHWRLLSNWLVEENSELIVKQLKE